MSKIPERPSIKPPSVAATTHMRNELAAGSLRSRPAQT